MPIRIATQTIILHRGGQRYKVKPGEKIDLSAAELDDIKRMNPDAVRTPRNETEDVKTANVPPADAKAAGGKSAKPGSDEL